MSLYKICFKIFLLMSILGCDGLEIIPNIQTDQRENNPGNFSETAREEEIEYDNTDPEQQTNVSKGKLKLHIQNIQGSDTVLITVEDNKNQIVATKKLLGSKTVEFNLEPGKYTVTTEAAGYNTSQAQQNFNVSGGGKIEKILEFEQETANKYSYHWESNLEGKQYEYSTENVLVNKVEFLNENINYSHSSAASEVLLQKYNLILSNDGDTNWTSILATKLLKNLHSIPHYKLSKTKIILTNQYLSGDISVDEQSSTVKLSTKAFNYSKPLMVKLNNQKGIFFSRRLFKALVLLYTNNGSNKRAIKKILEDKFNLKIDISRQKITELTKEHWDNFQSFKDFELINIIMALSETPKGFFKIKGLRYILRRRDGQPHPVLKNAIAVAHPRGPQINSYIEFMESAFFGSRTMSQIHKTVLHEKSHFLWTNVFSRNLKTEWIKIGGWYKNANDPSGWSTSSTTHFVTAYAHLLNPNEDMAESLSFYILNPKKLKSVAPEKYKFIEKYIMNGYKYVNKIRSDLQFEVLNLFPDYIYPGKIKRIDITALGSSQQDKQVTIEIELQKLAGYESGAEYAFMRIQSEEKTFKDLYLYPVNGNKYVLRGELRFPNLAKKAYWITEQIILTDAVGNKRFEGINDYGFKLFLNNKKEDTIKPSYVKKSMELFSSTVIKEGHEVFKVTANWYIKENEKLKTNGVYATLAFQGKDRVYSLKKWGKVDLETNKASVVFYINEYFPTGKYGISYINMIDRALNNGDQYFSKSPSAEAITSINISPSNRDNKKPELDLNKISIKAVPVNNNNLNGETLVNLKITVKDNKSGVGKISFYLQDPLGKRHHYYFYNQNTYSLFYKGGNPTKWRSMTTTVRLPKGSAPGTWGLYELYMQDLGGNFITYNFSELIHFELIQSQKSSRDLSSISNINSLYKILIPIFVFLFFGIFVFLFTKNYKCK